MAANKQPRLQKRPPVQKIKKGEAAPRFDTMFKPDSDAVLSLDEYPNASAEENANFEISEVLRRIKEEKRARGEQYRLITDPNFYLVLCFQSRGQRDEFIEKAKWGSLGYPYIDGLKLARLLGVDIAPVNLPRKQVRAAPRALRDSTME